MQRYVPDEVLNFKTVTYLDAGSDTPFPSSEGIDPRIYKTCPANFKVELTVSTHYYGGLMIVERSYEYYAVMPVV